MFPCYPGNQMTSRSEFGGQHEDLARYNMGNQMTPRNEIDGRMKIMGCYTGNRLTACH